MLAKSVLRTVIADQFQELKGLNDLVTRTLFSTVFSYGGASALVVKGVRRCGKSTLLKQLMNAKFKDDFLYFNFDDERVGDFRADDFQPLMETLIESFGDKKNVFFDEIQNVDGWELFVNRMLRQGYHVFLTGSNANLLSKELGTHLTGRHNDLELYPFSFTEFLKAKNIEFPKNLLYTTEQKAQLVNNFLNYFKLGGMPEAVLYSNEAILTSILNDIILKDISQRYQIRKTNELKTVIRFLIANASNLVTYRSIAKNFELKSSNTVQKYLEYAEEAYLVFTVKKLDKKIKKFDKNPKKIYCIDNGIITKNTPTTNERNGALLENIIAVHLKRLGEEFYYYKGKNGSETDFVIPSKSAAIQVCYELNYGNKERELNGLIEAMTKTNAPTGLILTLEQEEEIKYKNRKITIKPAW